MMGIEIQKMMVEKGLKKKDLAERCGWTGANLYNKLKRDNFSEAELRALAEALNCNLKIEFVPKDEK